MSLDNYIKVQTDIEETALKIIAYEKSGDDSMRGFWIGSLVTEYIRQMGTPLCDMFDFSLENQKKDHESYGDYDYSFTKVKVKGNSYRTYSDYNYIVGGAFIDHIFTGEKFTVVKIIETHKTLSSFTNIYYHIRQVNKTIKTIDLDKKYFYGDVRDEGYVVSYKKKDFGDNRISIDGDVAFYYQKYDSFYFVMEQIYKLIKNDI